MFQARILAGAALAVLLTPSALAQPSPGAAAQDGGRATSAASPAAEARPKAEATAPGREAAPAKPEAPRAPRREPPPSPRRAPKAVTPARLEKATEALVKNKKLDPRTKEKKALKLLDQVHDQEKKALRRIERVQQMLQRGEMTAAMKELERAKRAATKAAVATEEFAEAEELTATDYVVRSLLTLGIAVLAILLAWALALLTRRVLVRGVDVNGEAGSAAGRVAYRLLTFVFGLGLLTAATYLCIRYVWRQRISGSRMLEVLEHPLFAFEGRPVTLLSIAFFVLTIAALVILSRRIRRVLETRVMPKFSPDLSVQHAFGAIFFYLTIFLGLLVSLEVLGVGASTVAIVAGVVGLGIGFGMQHIINNFLSGFVVFFERHIRVGDVVDVGNVEGRVERVRARATTLVTRDNVTIIVPNSDFVQNKVTNLSFPDNQVRVRLKVGVSYGTDMDLVVRALGDVAAANPRVLQHPPPVVQILDFADSAIVVELIYWVSEILHRNSIASDLRFAIIREFREHDIQIPFPQRDVHFRGAELRAIPGLDLDLRAKPK